MARINKIEIAGIRSFSPDKPQTIEFYSPLTLILGKNGTGKTTILESLKYALSNEQPPNSKSGAFVNDPTLSNQKSRTTKTEAFVELKFCNKKNENMIIRRGLNLTKTLKNSSLKTTETSLSFEILEEDSKRTKLKTFDGKIADIDRDVLENMDMKKGMIDSVLLVHQNEFTWPFSDPLSLKKKMDQILEATNYVKFIEKLKVHKRFISTKVKLLEQKLEYSMSSKLKGEKIKQDIKELEDEIETKIKNLENQEYNFNNISKTILDNETSLTLFSDYLQKFIISNEKLKYYRGYFTEDYKENENIITERELVLKKKYGDRNIAELKLEYKELNSKIIQYEKIKEMNEKKIKIYEMEKMKKENLKKEINLKTNDIIEEMEMFQENLNFKFDLKSKNFSEDEITKIKDEIYIYENFFEEIDKQKEMIENILKIIVFFVQNFSKIGKLENEKLINKQEYEKNDEKDNLEKLKNLKAEIDENKLEIQNKIKVLGSKEYNYQKSIHDKFFSSKKHFRKEVVLKNLGELIILKSFTLEKSKLTIELQKEFEKLFFTLKKPNFLKEINNFSDFFEKIKTNRSFKSNLSTIKFSIEFYGKLYSSGKSKNICPLCNSNFDRKNFILKLENILEKLKEKKYEIEDEIKNDKYQLNSIELSEEDLKYIENIIENIKKIENKIVEKDSIIKGFTENKIEIKSEDFSFDEISNSFTILKDKKSKNESLQTKFDIFDSINIVKNLECINIQSFIVEITKNDHNLDDFNKKLENEIKYLKNYLTDLRSYDPTFLEIDINEMNFRLESLQRKYNGLKSDNNSSNENMLSLKMKFFSEQIKEIEDNLCTRKKELKEEFNLFKKDFIELIKKIKVEYYKDNEKTVLNYFISNDLTSSLDSESTEICIFLKIIAKNLRALTEILISFKENKKSSLFNILFKLKELLKANKQYKSMELEDYKEHLMEKIDKSELNDIKDFFIWTKKAKIEKEFSEFLEEIMKGNKIFSEAMHINLGENSSFNNEFDSNSVKEDLEKYYLQKKYKTAYKILEKILEKVVYNFEHKTQALKRKISREKEILEKIKAEKFVLKGNLDGLKSSVRDKQKNYEEMYKNCEEEYKNTFIENKAVELYLKDINLSISSAESSLIEYHKKKISEINEVLKRLWRNICSHNDIEYIELHLEMGNSYNYKMMMYKSVGKRMIPLEMRGRCSAGQKIISSILLRLALSEVFIRGPTIFALDEPTTNLDSNTIDSLALSLKNLFMEYENHQFVIITHDESFMGLINNGDPYFRLSMKDGFSLVEKLE